MLAARPSTSSPEATRKSPKPRVQTGSQAAATAHRSFSRSPERSFSGQSGGSSPLSRRTSSNNSWRSSGGLTPSGGSQASSPLGAARSLGHGSFRRGGTTSSDFGKSRPSTGISSMERSRSVSPRSTSDEGGSRCSSNNSGRSSPQSRFLSEIEQGIESKLSEQYEDKKATKFANSLGGHVRGARDSPNWEASLNSPVNTVNIAAAFSTEQKLAMRKGMTAAESWNGRRFHRVTKRNPTPGGVTAPGSSDSRAKSLGWQKKWSSEYASETRDLKDDDSEASVPGNNKSPSVAHWRGSISSGTREKKTFNDHDPWDNPVGSAVSSNWYERNVSQGGPKSAGAVLLRSEYEDLSNGKSQKASGEDCEAKDEVFGGHGGWEVEIAMGSEGVREPREHMFKVEKPGGLGSLNLEGGSSRSLSASPRRFLSDGLSKRPESARIHKAGGLSPKTGTKPHSSFSDLSEPSDPNPQRSCTLNDDVDLEDFDLQPPAPFLDMRSLVRGSSGVDFREAKSLSARTRTPLEESNGEGLTPIKLSDCPPPNLLRRSSYTRSQSNCFSSHFDDEADLESSDLMQNLSQDVQDFEAFHHCSTAGSLSPAGRPFRSGASSASAQDKRPRNVLRGSCVRSQHRMLSPCNGRDEDGELPSGSDVKWDQQVLGRRSLKRQDHNFSADSSPGGKLQPVSADHTLTLFEGAPVTQAEVLSHPRSPKRGALSPMPRRLSTHEPMLASQARGFNSTEDERNGNTHSRSSPRARTGHRRSMSVSAGGRAAGSMSPTRQSAAVRIMDADTRPPFQSEHSQSFDGDGSLSPTRQRAGSVSPARQRSGSLSSKRHSMSVKSKSSDSYEEEGDRDGSLSPLRSPKLRGKSILSIRDECRTSHYSGSEEGSGGESDEDEEVDAFEFLEAQKQDGGMNCNSYDEKDKHRKAWADRRKVHWSKVESVLRELLLVASKLNTAADLRVFIVRYTTDRSVADQALVGLENCLKTVTNREKFFQTTLPCIVRRALEFSTHFHKGFIAMLRPKDNYQRSVPRTAVASIVANMFLCALPINEVSFSNLLCSQQTYQITKLAAFIHYFERLSKVDTKEPRGDIFVSKNCVSLGLDWAVSSCSFEKLEIVEGLMDEERTSSHFMTSKADIGGGLLYRGRGLEEVRYCAYPELVIGMFVCVKLGKSESLVVRGVEKYVDFEGSDKIQTTYKGLDSDPAPRDEQGNFTTTFIASDPHKYDRGEALSCQLQKSELNWDLEKARTAFMLDRSVANSLTISTTHWGCDHFFNGDKEIKFLVQWMAASVNRRSLTFFITDVRQDAKLKADVEKLIQVISANDVSVGQIYEQLEEVAEFHPQPKKVIDQLLAALNLSQKQERAS